MADSNERPNNGRSKPHTQRGEVDRSGPLAWMATNSVAANLLMVVLLAGGAIMLLTGQLKEEVFPEFTLDIITVQVPYPGASPEEVEQGVILAIEEAVRGVDGIKRVRSTASEGIGSVTIELMLGSDRDEVLSDVRGAIDRVTSFPADAEEPVVSVVNNRSEVISMVIHGDLDRHQLHTLANIAREGLLADPSITTVEIDGLPPIEMSIEVPQDELRTYGLTLQDVADIVSASSIELPGGEVQTDGGGRPIRTDSRLREASEFEDIQVLSLPNGTNLNLGDIATVNDGFRDTDQAAFFDGEPAVRVLVYRVGDQTPIEISDAVQEYAAEFEATLPDGANIALWNDMSEIYRDRIGLLVKNARLGLLLVLLILGFFLEIRLAFWVTMGIPISFLGAILFMPWTDVSINMISLFAFILTLGIVVDDAIVVGEAVFKYRQEGHKPIDAAILGAREVAKPVIFAILTTVIAFTPMFFVPGATGKLFAVIPAIVIIVLLLSMFESLFILPAHLAHLSGSDGKGVMAWISRQQGRFAEFYDRVVEKLYQPVVRLSSRLRYATLALGVATLVAMFGYVGGGHVPFSFLPRVESDVVFVDVQLPFGAPIEQTEAIRQQIEEAAQVVFAEMGSRDEHSRGVYSTVGSVLAGGGPDGFSTVSGSHLAQVSVFLVGADNRGFSTAEFTRRWREEVGEVPGLERLTFTFNIGPSGGSAVDVELTHTDIAVLEQAAIDLADQLAEYDGVREINDGFSAGKEQLNIDLRPEARALGLTDGLLARQVRNSFFGAEAIREQRGREELRIYVRLPESERRSEHNIEELIIRTPAGGEMLLGDAATVRRGVSYTSIERTDGRRVINVTADVDEEITTGNEVAATLEEDVLPDLLGDYRGLDASFAGEQREQADAMGSLAIGGVFAILAMFALMAISFRSYIQPVIVMSAIPFGFVGAIGGHIIMGYGLSMMSMMGMIALAGVVVNDSLILVTSVNDYKEAGYSTFDAVVEGGTRRFRPIMLTSLTTFFGLIPMIAETSVQARFLIPMAISLGFGVLFTTFVTLIIVPALYVIVDDVRWFFSHSALSWFVGFDEIQHDTGSDVGPSTADPIPAE